MTELNWDSGGKRGRIDLEVNKRRSLLRRSCGPIVRDSKQLIRQENFSGGMVVKNPLANTRYPGDAGLIPESGRSLEKEMATHCSILAWEIPWAEEPGGLQSMESQRVKHNLETKQQQHWQRVTVVQSLVPNFVDPDPLSFQASRNHHHHEELTYANQNSQETDI